MERMDLMRQCHSVRQYTDRVIEPEKREALTALAQQFNREVGKGFYTGLDLGIVKYHFEAVTGKKPL